MKNANIRQELKKNFRDALRTRTKAMILAEALPFDPFELKIFQVINVSKPSNAAFGEKLKTLVQQQFFFKLELAQRMRNQVAMRTWQQNEDAILAIENEIDFESPPMFKYVSKNVLSANFPDIERSAISGCRCEGGCSEKTLCCPQSEGFEFPYIKIHGREVHRYIDSQKMIECGPGCSCDDDCLNRLTQKKKTVKVCVFKTEKRGWGLKASDEIKARTYIGEYVGEVLKSADAETREGSHYLFEVNSEEYDDPITIDAEKLGNLTRFINHSCEPNAHVRYVNLHGGRQEDEKICIFSSRIIKKGEEIVISYSGGQSKKEVSTIKCQCGSSKCKGFVF